MGKEKKSKLSRRITWRVIGIIVFFNVLIIGAIIVFTFIVSLLSGSSRGQYVTDGIAGNMETMMWVVKTVANNNRAEVEANLDSPEQVFDALERELRINKGLVGSFAAFEPDYFKSEGRWFEAYAYFADSMKIERRQIGSPKHDYFKSAWYEKALNLDLEDDGYLTDPYFDDSVGNGMYCSYVLPIFDRQGRKVGVFGVVLDISWLNESIHAIEKTVLKEVYSDSVSILKEGLKRNTLFSIQIIDSKGNRIAGSDSLDLSILKGEQAKVDDDLEMADLKGTYYYINSKHLNYTNWTLAVLQGFDMVFLYGEILAVVILLFMGVGGIVIFFFTGRSISHATKPLAFLSESAQEVAKGNFDTSLPTFEHNDEVTQLRDSFGIMQQSLKQYVEELKTSTAAKASIESELTIAHNIQMSMLPKTFPAFPNRKDIELYAELTPAKAVGGDLYDFFIHDERLFFCIGDVSGKGVPASLVMAVTRTLFRNIAVHTFSPSHIVQTMNMNVCEGNDNCMFVTLFVGVLDLQTGHLRYCNAGHDAPYILKEKGKVESGQSAAAALLACDSNLPIGIMSDGQYTEQEADMTSGDMLFLYTDGLTEAENSSHELFGEDRITDVIAAFDGSPQELIASMTGVVRQFVGDYEQSDDLTMLAIQYKK